LVIRDLFKLSIQREKSRVGRGHQTEIVSEAGDLGSKLGIARAVDNPDRNLEASQSADDTFVAWTWFCDHQIRMKAQDHLKVGINVAADARKGAHLREVIVSGDPHQSLRASEADDHLGD